MSANFGAHELTDDEAASAETFARAIERAVLRKNGLEVPRD